MRNLQVYKPFGDLFTDLDSFMWGSKTSETWVPSVDVKEDKEGICIRAEIPGMKKEDVKIHVEGDVLTLSGEKKIEKKEEGENWYRSECSYGSFSRSFTLPKVVDVEHINAKMQDGVLEVKIAKKEAHHPKEIDIEVH